MSMFNESLERVYLELVTIYVSEKRQGNEARSELAWDLTRDMERMWPEKIQEIEERHRTPAKE